MSSTTSLCPQCSAALPVHEDFVQWCEHCEWNVHDSSDAGPTTFMEKFYSAMSRRHGRALFDSVIAARQVRPPVTGATILAYAGACFIHLMTIAIAVAAPLLIILGWPNVLFIVLGVCCIGFLWVVRPRVQDMPVVLPRNEFPAMYELADTVADALGAKRVDGISIDGDYNAAFGLVGWRRRRILYLGLPLWTVLNNEEKVDLVAHELAHSINNDAREGFFVGMAVDTLYELHEILYPTHILPTEAGFFAFAAVPFTLASLGLSHIVRLAALGMEHLL